MRKRERENPCGVCGHYHRYEEGEVCGVCGHRAAAAAPTAERAPGQQVGSAFSSEILGGFLYLGSYDNASRGELLKTQGISRILNTVPSCQNLYKNSFTYHCLQDEKTLQFDDAIQFLEQCEKDRARVLVHCMSGRSRSPAVVIAYLMKSKGWRLVQGLHWVKERRSSVDLSPAVYQQLLDYEQRIFGSNEANQVQNSAAGLLPSFGFGFPGATTDASPLPTFNQPTSSSIFDRTYPNTNSNEFVFGAGMRNGQRVAGTTNNTESGTEAPMDREGAMARAFWQDIDRGVSFLVPAGVSPVPPFSSEILAHVQLKVLMLMVLQDPRRPCSDLRAAAERMTEALALAGCPLERWCQAVTCSLIFARRREFLDVEVPGELAGIKVESLECEQGMGQLSEGRTLVHTTVAASREEVAAAKEQLAQLKIEVAAAESQLQQLLVTQQQREATVSLMESKFDLATKRLQELQSRRSRLELMSAYPCAGLPTLEELLANFHP